MTYVITSKCGRVGLCVDVCPTDSIHFVDDDPEWPTYYIDPDTCIECGACVSACPATHTNARFMGPAVLSAMHIELKKYPPKEKELISLAGNERGVRLCERALKCSRVCPTGVYPARHIADLKGQLNLK